MNENLENDIQENNSKKKSSMVIISQGNLT
jgi:hypothetical protein